MKTQVLCILTFLCLIWVFTGCSLRQQIERNALLAQIDEAEKIWQEQGIGSYRLEVEAISLWHDQFHQMTVTNQKVVEQSASCIPAPIEYRDCEVRPFDAEDYTVPGLFSRARWLAERGDPQWVRIEFDATYGFPRLISFNDPEIIDEE